MKKISAVLFDLDGTLVDSLEDIADAMNRVLARCGYPGHTYDEYRYLVGKGLANLTARCLPEGARDEENVVRCLAMMMDEYRANAVVKSRLYDGIAELLDALSEAGVGLAILSNKADELTQVICERLLGRWTFEAVLGASARFPRKPDPTAALHIAREMEVAPEKFLYVGDTDTDMQTAAAAGMFAIGVTWGFRPRRELVEHGAQAVIDRPIELLDHLR